MATQVQFRRGTSTENNSFTGALGEVTVDTTNDTLRVHDGSTAGGFQSAKLTGTQDITLNNQADLRFGDSDGSHYVALQAPGTVSSNVTFTLPAADGSSGQAMVTDASGNLSFAAAGATISADTSTDTDFLLYFAATTSGALTAVKQDSGLLYNPSSGTLTSAAFTGVASSAKYADLAERYTSDSNYEAGTVLVFGGAIGLFVALSNEKVLDFTNRLLVLFIVSALIGLVSLCVGEVDAANLERSDFSVVGNAIPGVAVAFVYQSVLPSVVSSLEGDVPKIKKATILGTAVPLAMFLLWNAVVLGALSGEDLMTSGVNPVDLLASKIESGYGTVLIDAFSFSAVATSFMALVTKWTSWAENGDCRPSTRNGALKTWTCAGSSTAFTRARRSPA